MSGENGTLRVRIAGRSVGRLRVCTGDTVLGRAGNGANTPFVLAPGTHRIRVRGGWPVRSNTVTVDVPADGRVQLAVRTTWIDLAMMVPAPLYWLTGQLWALASMIPILVLIYGVPGTLVGLRAVEL
ncbi:hypothetical protein ACIQF6_04760 [Kitasatospora sp. NPDC092948]|uniref:hypothetical protein n=1 Tax=Kitasatospora sp. NPDC092948 TaxID=3364088 RepID=UPI00381E9F18